jgi:hypothetical protein
MICYFQRHNRIARLYYDFWRRRGRHASLFPFIENEEDHYHAQYVLTKEFHRRLHPFQFLEEGDRVVSIGFHDQYIAAGISHPLIISGIIGEAGHIWAVDPHKTNTESLSRYSKINAVRNLSVIRAGV